MTPEARARKNEQDRLWRLAHPGYMTAQHRSWRERNPERSKLNDVLKQNRRRASFSVCPPASFAEVSSLPRECQLCGGPGEHLDHIAPLSAIQCQALHNLQWLCAPCNLRKSDSTGYAHLGCPKWSG